MEETEIKNSDSGEEKFYSQKEVDEMNEKLKMEFQKREEELKMEIKSQIEKAGMSELELAKTELEEMKQKYLQKENECTMAKEKEETIALLKEASLNPMVLELVYQFKDMAKTKSNIEVLKNFIEVQKQELLKEYFDAPKIETQEKNKGYDPFVEGFDTNRL